MQSTLKYNDPHDAVEITPDVALVARAEEELSRLAKRRAPELQPQNIHVAHIVIDGAIRNPGRTEPADRPDSMLDRDAIAQTYLHLVQQHRSAWAWEIELRPWVETF